MLRSLYHCVLRLHPPRFRERFAEEMLSIFDHHAGIPAAFTLLLDGFSSLLRQWTLRPEFWHDISPAPQPVPDGIPAFSTLDPFRPRPGAVIHGLVLSLAIFAMTCFAIKYSWIRVLHVHIPEIQFESQQSIEPGFQAMKQSMTHALVPQAASNASALVQHSAVVSQPKHASSSELPAAPEASLQSSRETAPAPIADKRNAMHHSPTSGIKPEEDPGASLSPASHGSTVATSGAGAQKELNVVVRQLVLDAVVRNLKEHYFDPEIGRKMGDDLQAHENAGDDNVANDAPAFADLLTRQIRDVSQDLHLVVVYSQDRLPKLPATPTPQALASYRNELERNNCGFKKIEILPHNIGYLKLNAFPDSSICRSTATASMATLNQTNVIIFDLRDNQGGYANMVSLIAGYLFSHPEYIYDPRVSPTQQSWTQSPVAGNRLVDKPVYVLTSGSTASAAEQFCYNLKMLRRATLVGETTSGNAHAGAWYRIDDHFGMGIPEMRAINPYSKTDWEGTGVEPDVKVKAADALPTAVQLAQAKLQKK
jgi:hypothetical protein